MVDDLTNVGKKLYIPYKTWGKLYHPGKFSVALMRRGMDPETSRLIDQAFLDALEDVAFKEEANYRAIEDWQTENSFSTLGTIEHVSLEISSQTVTSSGGFLQFDIIEGSPKDQIGFSGLSVPSTSIPVSIAGLVDFILELELSSSVDIDFYISRIRDGIEEKFFDESGSSVNKISGSVKGWVRVGDSLKLYLNPSSAVDVLGTLQVSIWELSLIEGVYFLETLWVDSRSSTGVTSTSPLELGEIYTLVVEGNFRLFPTTYTYTNPTDAILYPSPSLSSDSFAHLDAEVIYSGTVENGDISSEFPRHSNLLIMDTGSGFSHKEEVNGPLAVENSAHTYKFKVVGQGSPITIKISDSSYLDNNGQLKCDLYRGEL